ncbi:hypothetical protein SAMN04488109_0186 [Chryseolinea serpens]|uniref:Uncharacterized protein n=1 Tax=Chryseolinea serpens TaxID=947013 RepID=A0A1M5JNV5_9BACT|nr:hypothetical protein [Chryseolinea serpens]SHG42085.1 hypothetical protein SAMN04488109_0186 [Chryseolinea serpens]
MKRVLVLKKDLSPTWVKIVGVMIFLATLYKIISLTFFTVGLHVYLIMNLIAVLIWLVKTVLVVDMDKQEVREGLWIFGNIYLDKYKFQGLEKIFINRVNSVQTFRQLTRTIDIHNQHYKAFLKTTDGEKICIGEDADKDKLIAEVKAHNTVLKTVIFDNSLVEPIQLV